MKRCIETHHVLSFGEIPEGSTWDDDSEYITKKNAKFFEALPATVGEPGPEMVELNGGEQIVEIGKVG